MNKLQTEIEKAIVDHVWRDQIDQTAIAKAAAEVALKWIEKAFKDGENNGHNRNYMVEVDKEGQKADFQKWLILNGLTPTEPGITDPPNETKKV